MMQNWRAIDLVPQQVQGGAAPIAAMVFRAVMKAASLRAHVSKSPAARVFS